MKKRLLIIILFLFCLSGCKPNTITAGALAEANKHYDQKEYSSAIQSYEVLIDDGVEDGVLYYNLGNAWYKQGSLGKAILNYRKAQLFLPRDADIRANLALARSLREDQLESDKRPGQFLYNSVTGLLTFRESLTILTGLWLLFSLLFILRLLKFRYSRLLHGLIMICLGLMVFFMITSTVHIADRQGHEPGVITISEVEVKSGPGEDFVTEFLLHDGTEIRRLETRNGWTRIRIPGDLQGWIPTQGMELIQENK